LAPSLRRALDAEIERVLGLYWELYRSFTVKHFHEQLLKQQPLLFTPRRAARCPKSR
jgi:hypothetical protein